MPSEEFASMRALAEQKVIENVEMGIVKPDKTVTWLNVSAAPVPLKDFGVIIAYADITRRVEAEQGLKKNDELLQERALELKALNDTKDKFFRIIAHDLRNPFGSLVGASEYLYKGAGRFDRERIRELSRILMDTSKSGYEILSNLLDWSRSQTGNLLFNPAFYNLSDLIGVNLNILSAAVFSKELVLENQVTSDISVFADKEMLNTILRNLLTNAIKFTPKGGAIWIGAEQRSETVLIKIKDSGVGISSSEMEKLFRLDAHYVKRGTDNEKGTGLGLILCKEFAERHGGSIQVGSAEGKGSEFIVVLPYPDQKPSRASE